MNKRYKAAIVGYGGAFKALKRAWSSRFSSIKSVIMIPELSESIRLEVSYDATREEDVITLHSRNWRTGQETILFDGSLRAGQLRHKRNKRS